MVREKKSGSAPRKLTTKQKFKLERLAFMDSYCKKTYSMEELGSVSMCTTLFGFPHFDSVVLFYVKAVAAMLNFKLFLLFQDPSQPLIRRQTTVTMIQSAWMNQRQVHPQVNTL